MADCDGGITAAHRAPLGVDSSTISCGNCYVIIYGDNAHQPRPVRVGRVVDGHACGVAVRLRSDRHPIKRCGLVHSSVDRHHRTGMEAVVPGDGGIALA